MKLSDYLTKKKMTATQFANKLGVAVSTVTRACKGEAIPDRCTMSHIISATGGKVLPNDFFNIPK